jgi:hypothetical protein
LSVARPLRLQVVGEKPVEGYPAEAGQARMQMSIHVKVVGLSLVLRGHVPARVLSRTSPDPLASWNTEGTLGRLNGEGRRKRSYPGLFCKFGYR